VYISKEGGLAINGNALTFGGSGGLFFYYDVLIQLLLIVKKFKVRLELKCNYLYRDFDTLGLMLQTAKQYCMTQ
jgi:hypothetical protein